MNDLQVLSDAELDAVAGGGRHGSVDIDVSLRNVNILAVAASQNNVALDVDYAHQSNSISIDADQRT
jgi:hypothetical protein